MEPMYLVLALLLMIAGLAGAFLPVLPSAPLVYVGYAVYGLATGWRQYGLGVMLALGVVTVLVVVIDYVSGAVGAKQFGASRIGTVGSILGAIVGLIVFNAIGLVIGVFVGAVLGELIEGRTLDQAARSGWGALLGFLAGSVFKFIVSASMIAAFLLFILF